MTYFHHSIQTHKLRTCKSTAHITSSLLKIRIYFEYSSGAANKTKRLKECLYLYIS